MPSTKAGPVLVVSPRELKDLRNFGLVLGAIFGGVFGTLFPALKHGGDLSRWPLWPWCVALPLALAALAAPRVLRPVFRYWTKLGHVLGYVNSRIILGGIFFALFTPLAALFRLLGKDPMSRKLDAQAQSYRIPRTTADVAQMEKPF